MNDTYVIQVTREYRVEVDAEDSLDALIRAMNVMRDTAPEPIGLTARIQGATTGELTDGSHQEVTP
jgi:hypothetical protein